MFLPRSHDTTKHIVLAPSEIRTSHLFAQLNDWVVGSVRRRRDHDFVGVHAATMTFDHMRHDRLPRERHQYLARKPR